MMKIDKTIQTYGKTHNVPISLDETLQFLLDTIKNENCKQILEIGTAIGYSSIAVAENTMCDHIDTVEIDANRFEIANKNIQEKHLEDKIATYLMDAKDYIKNCTKKYDFIYLDGPKGQYINYLPMLVPLLNPNGIIFADNLYFHGMVTGTIPVPASCRAMIKGLHKYIDEITTNPMFDTRLYDIGDGIGLTKLKIKI